MAADAKYILRFLVEWGGGCLWGGNDAAYRDFDLGPYDMDDPCPLPLQPSILERCRRLGDWHDASLNREYPPHPGPWRQPECNRFNAAIADLLADLREGLGPEFEVIDQQHKLSEDPELDAYLADPSGFRRRTV